MGEDSVIFFSNVATGKLLSPQKIAPQHACKQLLLNLEGHMQKEESKVAEGLIGKKHSSRRGKRVGEGTKKVKITKIHSINAWNCQTIRQRLSTFIYILAFHEGPDGCQSPCFHLPRCRVSHPFP